MKRKAQPAEEDQQPGASAKHQKILPNASQHLFRVDGLVALITGGGTGECRVATMNEIPV
jgi:hypothetical protein